MGVVRKSITALVIELIKKSYRQGADNTDGQSWKKISSVYLIRYKWPDEVCDTIHDEDNNRSYYEVAELQTVSGEWFLFGLLQVNET